MEDRDRRDDPDGKSGGFSCDLHHDSVAEMLAGFCSKRENYTAAFADTIEPAIVIISVPA